MKRTITVLTSMCLIALLFAFITNDLKSGNAVDCKQLFKVVDGNGSPIQSAWVVVSEHPNGSTVGTCQTDLTGYCPHEMNLVVGQSYIAQVTLNPGPGSGSQVFTACVSPEVVIEAK